MKAIIDSADTCYDDTSLSKEFKDTAEVFEYMEKNYHHWIVRFIKHNGADTFYEELYGYDVDIVLTKYDGYVE